MFFEYGAIVADPDQEQAALIVFRLVQGQLAVHIRANQVFVRILVNQHPADVARSEGNLRGLNCFPGQVDPKHFDMVVDAASFSATFGILAGIVVVHFIEDVGFVFRIHRAVEDRQPVPCPRSSSNTKNPIWPCLFFSRLTAGMLWHYTSKLLLSWEGCIEKRSPSEVLGAAFQMEMVSPVERPSAARTFRPSPAKLPVSVSISRAFSCATWVLVSRSE